MFGAKFSDHTHVVDCLLWGLDGKGNKIAMWYLWIVKMKVKTL